MQRARQSKELKYRPFLQAVEQGRISSLSPGSVRFVPFVLDSGGGIEGTARKFLASVCGYQPNNEFTWTKEFFDFYAAMRAVSLAAQRARTAQTVACLDCQPRMRQPPGSFDEHFGALFEGRGPKPNILRGAPTTQAEHFGNFPASHAMEFAPPPESTANSAAS